MKSTETNLPVAFLDRLIRTLANIEQEVHSLDVRMCDLAYDVTSILEQLNQKETTCTH